MVQRLGSAFEGVLAEHNRIMRAAVEESGGTEVSTDGDAFFAVFSTPVACMDAALVAQRALREQPWPEGGRVTVRMGAHSGEGSLGGDNYVGLDVNRAARVAAAAHGGQILVSEPTRALIGHSRDADVEFRDLGNYHLKDLDHAEQIFQLVAPDLPSDFPPLRTADVPINLPAQHSEFVGRPKEIEDVTRLLEAHRLITLTGVGGTGKTRLAVYVASGLIDNFPDGIFFVALDSFDHSDRVPSAIATVIGATGDLDPISSIIEVVGSGSMLLVLDNFEHVLAASSYVVRLLDSCPGLRVLVTSQTLLRLREEQVYPVPPLGLPADNQLLQVESSDSAALFVRRVWATDPSFEITEENSGAIAAIVTSLDGLPLAIELAASRVRLFGIDGLRAELDTRMSALDSGFSDAPERHQTLNNAIDWSYGLLEPHEKALLRSASVFVGGFSLDALEAVCRHSTVPNTLDALASLLDKSLVNSVSHGGKARFSMLKTIRAYATARLEEAGEAEEVGRSHAVFFTNLATGGVDSFRGPAGHTLMDRLVSERGNLSTAIEWSAYHDPELGLSAMMVLARYFEIVGGLDEGRDQGERLLQASGASTEARLTGLLGTASLLYWLHDYNGAEPLYDEAIVLADQLGDSAQSAEALFGLGYTYIWQGRLDEADLMIDRAHSAFERVGDRAGVRRVIAAKGTNQWLRGDIEGATPTFVSYFQESRAQGDTAEEHVAQLALGGLWLRRGEYVIAASIFIHVVERCQALDDYARLIMALDYAAIAVAHIDPTTGIRLEGAVMAIKDRRGGSLDLTILGLGDARTIAGSTVDHEEVRRLWEEGRELDLPEAVELLGEWAEQSDIESAPVDIDLVLKPRPTEGAATVHHPHS